MKNSADRLVLVTVDGKYTEVENTYDGIKSALEQRPFDFVRGSEQFGCYLDDEGMLLGLALNVPVSLMLGRAIYGPAVCCNGATDDEGDTLPMEEGVRATLEFQCRAWQNVVATAGAVGQDPYSYANEDTIPPPTIITLGPDDSIEDAVREHGYVIIADPDLLEES